MRFFRFVVPLLAVGCGGGGASVSIVFPNDVARDSVRRLRVEAYDPEAGGGPSERNCSDFLGKARLGMDPLGAPVRADYQCVATAQNPCGGGWFNGRDDLKIPRGRRIIYVLAFATTDEGATPILEGCTDRFDSDGGSDESDDVPIELTLVIPENARMIKSAGDRQVGRAGEELSVPLEVRVQADSPDGTGGTYDIPGVPIRFTSEDPSFAMVSGDSAERYETYTNDEGRASVRVRLPSAAGSGEIVAFASALAMEMSSDRSELVFSVSVTEPVSFQTKDVLSTGDGALPIAVALGSLDGMSDLDLAVVSCQGSREACTPGVDAVAPFGATRLTVFANVGNVGARTQVRRDERDAGGSFPAHRGWRIWNLRGARAYRCSSTWRRSSTWCCCCSSSSCSPVPTSWPKRLTCSFPSPIRRGRWRSRTSSSYSRATTP